jgi:pantoate--beta-alanine ligase
VPIVREPDGLALSSRNAYLSAEQRPLAATLQRALAAGAGVSARGPEAVLAAAREVLEAQPEVAVDYLELRDPELGRDPQAGRARLLVAARVGTTRLIDNVAVQL